MSGVLPWIAPLVVLLAAAWLALLVAAPLLPAVPAALTYAFGSLICHQIPERSFYLGASQLPVCARCLGIYAGVAAACGAGLVSPAVGRQARSTPRIRTVLLAGVAPTLVTVAAEWAGMWPTSKVVRALAGALLGIAVGAVVIGALATLHYDECAPPPPPIAPDRPPRHI
jgi:uncharacterized membrane protein